MDFGRISHWVKAVGSLSDKFRGTTVVYRPPYWCGMFKIIFACICICIQHLRSRFIDILNKLRLSQNVLNERHIVPSDRFCRHTCQSGLLLSAWTSRSRHVLSCQLTEWLDDAELTGFELTSKITKSPSEPDLLLASILMGPKALQWAPIMAHLSCTVLYAGSWEASSSGTTLELAVTGIRPEYGAIPTYQLM
jgi:hypothetical protein